MLFISEALFAIVFLRTKSKHNCRNAIHKLNVGMPLKTRAQQCQVNLMWFTVLCDGRSCMQTIQDYTSQNFCIGNSTELNFRTDANDMNCNDCYERNDVDIMRNVASLSVGLWLVIMC